MDVKFRYSDFVNYSRLDPVKRLAIELFQPTLKHTERLGIRVIAETVGEPAVALDLGGIGDTDWLLVSNVEGLGSKNIIADAAYSRAFREKKRIADNLGLSKLYRGLGQDVIAACVNDQVAIGADVFAYHDLVSCGDSKWFSQDWERTRELLLGYRLAADDAQLAIPQGETPEVPEVLVQDALDLAGSALGLVRPKHNLVTGGRIEEGDLIYGLESNGPHANGITKIRRIAEALHEGYLTPVGEGQTLAEAALMPTTLYSRPVLAMLSKGIDVHYLQPITGHGWAKICRARQNFTYIVEKIPEPPRIFQKLVEWGHELGFDVSSRENYYTWNMGIGFVVIAPAEAQAQVLDIAAGHNIGCHILGRVVRGDRQVLMPFVEDGKQVVYPGG